MTLDAVNNFAKVTVSTGYDAAAVTIVLSTGDGTKLPTAPFNLVWWDNSAYADPADDPNKEIVRVTNVATDTLTITRAQEGTSATTKNTGGHTYRMIEAFTKLTYDLIDTHITNTSSVHGATGDVVGTSDTQNLTNKTLDNTNTVTLKDTLFTIQDNTDTSKQAVFQASGIDPATTRTLTIPNENITIVGVDATQTLTNKTISDDSNTITNIDFETAIKQSTFASQNFVNYVSNGSFESWSSGITSAPDGWTLSGLSATVDKETTTIKVGLASAKLTRAGTDCLLTNNAYVSMGSTYIRNRTFTFGAWVYATVASRVRLRIDDGVTQTYSSYHTGGSSWEFLTVTATAGGAVSVFNVGLSVDTGNTSGYIDGAILCEGTLVSGFRDKPLQDDAKSIIIDSATNKVTISELISPLIFPASDSTTAIQITKTNESTVIMNVDSTNARVGFGGNTSPAQAVDITGSGRASISFIGTTSLVTPIIAPVSDSTTALKITKADGITNIVNIDTTNSEVGIGTTSPDNKLHILTADGGNDGLKVGDGNGYILMIDGTGAVSSYLPTIRGVAAGADQVGLYLQGRIPVAQDSGTIATMRFTASRDDAAAVVTRPLFQFDNAGTVAMLIDVTGNVGIGTATPSSYKLYVKDTLGQVILESSTGTNRVNYRCLNTGGNVLFGIDSSAGGQISIGSSAYAAVLNHDGAYSMQFGTNNNVRMTIDSAGKVGIGTSSPSTLLHLFGADNTTVQTITINTTSANVTAADTFIDFRSSDGSIGSIAGTASSGVIAYNTFTGSHYTEVVGVIPEINMLLEIIDEKPFKVQKQLFKTKVCSTKGSKNAIGSYGGRDSEGRDLVLSIGTGYLWIANKGFDLEVGDYLISSDVLGCAEKQDDNVYKNITVGKLTENIKWKENEVKRLVSVIYLGG